MHGPDVSDIGRTATWNGVRGVYECICTYMCVRVCVSAAQVALPINEGRRYSQEWTEKGRPIKDKKRKKKGVDESRATSALLHPLFPLSLSLSLSPVHLRANFYSSLPSLPSLIPGDTRANARESNIFSFRVNCSRPRLLFVLITPERLVPRFHKIVRQAFFRAKRLSLSLFLSLCPITGPRARVPS